MSVFFSTFLCEFSFIFVFCVVVFIFCFFCELRWFCVTDVFFEALFFCGTGRTKHILNHECRLAPLRLHIYIVFVCMSWKDRDQAIYSPFSTTSIVTVY